MSLLEIVKHPNDILRRKARPVDEIDDKTQRLIDDMIETMRKAPGVGLAAPQVNVPLRIVVIEFGDEEDEDGKPGKKQLFTLINPEITRMATESEIGNEGCLSIPGLVGDVARATSVTVKALNRRGQAIKIKAKGWLARIFQHEIDHLNGVLFIDKAENIQRIQDEDELESSRV